MNANNQERPDPDALLKRVQADESAQRRGRLKVFFGMCPGVGKTYAMLEAARALAAQGKPVVVGIVETHGRPETARLLEGLDVLPRKSIVHRGVTLQEFNLDAALERRTALVLLDELAHTNAPGSKNDKRWMDVLALLNAGIDVFTTVNVQHLESLNDVVAKITGVLVRETVPDSVIEDADEIELIDLAPDELLQRLNEGKVYLPEQAGRAAEHFFKKGNLIALRELALRRTAERVHAQVQHYRLGQSVSVTWPTSERLLVCVGPSPFSARLIRATRRMATGLQCKWFAVSVETPANPAMSHLAQEQLQVNLRLAEQLGGETVSVRAESIVSGLLRFARDNNISKIIVGKPMMSRWRERLFGSLVDELIRRSGDIDVYVIKGDTETTAPQEKASSIVSAGWKPYSISVASVVVATLLGKLMEPYFELSNIIMVYLLGVVAVAGWLGRGPAILCTVLGVAAFDFFFVPPHFTFAVADTQYLVTFAVMLIVGIVIGTLTASVRAIASESAARERRTAALYAMSRELASARGAATLLQIVIRHVADVFASDVVGMLLGPSGRLEIRAGDAARFPFDDRERAVAHWALDTGQHAGLGTPTLPSAGALYVPLAGAAGPVGVLGIQPRSGGFTGEQLVQVNAFATQAALAIECDRLMEQAQRAQVAAEAEQSRTALLSMVSHDLRTPLTAIAGASSSLLAGERQTESVQRELVVTIHDEAERLSRLVTNLLEMTKLQAAPVVTHREAVPLEELVGSALTRLERVLKDRKVHIDFERGIPMAHVDALLTEQVLVNLLENAQKYSPASEPIDIVARAERAALRVEIRDRGPGVPVQEREKIFGRFIRGASAGSQRGSGLGLAICKAAIEAHGGTIGVLDRQGGGATFWFTLPVAKDCSVHAPQEEAV